MTIFSEISKHLHEDPLTAGEKFLFAALAAMFVLTIIFW